MYTLIYIELQAGVLLLLCPPKDRWLPPGSFGFLRCLHCSVKGKHLWGTAEVLLELLGIVLPSGKLT